MWDRLVGFLIFLLLSYLTDCHLSRFAAVRVPAFKLFPPLFSNLLFLENLGGRAAGNVCKAGVCGGKVLVHGPVCTLKSPALRLLSRLLPGLLSF